MISKLFRKQFLTFVMGAFFGIILITSYAFLSKSTPPQRTSMYQAVALNDAVAITSAYATNATPMNKVFRGFAVNNDQLEAMNKIMKENPNAIGFRVYQGVSAGGDEQSVIVGISPDGKDAVAGSMYTTMARNSGPCPTVCDQESPLNDSGAQR